MDGMEKMITLTPSAFRVEFPWNAGGMGLQQSRLLTKNLTAFPYPGPLSSLFALKTPRL